MGLQYLSDEKGHITAVQIPIKEWEMIKTKYPGVTHLDPELPEWQKKIINTRLDDLKNSSDSIRPIAELFEELDK